MADKANPIPSGYNTVSPYLVVKDAAAAVDFYSKAFSAKLRNQINGPNNTVNHAELQIGNSMIMLTEEAEERGSTGPSLLGGTPVSLLIYVEDADALFNQALQAGAEEIRPMKDQFFGDRMGSLQDPFGHIWHIATHKRDVPHEEMQRLSDEFMAKMAAHA